MNASLTARRNRGDTKPQTLIIVVAIVIAVLFGIYLLWPKPEPIPEPGQPLETVEPAKSAEERGDSAREIIAELREAPGGPDYAAAYAHAQEYLANGRSADAQLLYFFAARAGYGPAAFDLATFNDPNHHAAAVSPVTEPDPFQAYRWYAAARDAGHDGAQERLEELRAWAEDASDAGDPDAEQLLLQWEQAP